MFSKCTGINISGIFHRWKFTISRYEYDVPLVTFYLWMRAKHSDLKNLKLPILMTRRPNLFHHESQVSLLSEERTIWIVDIQNHGLSEQRTRISQFTVFFFLYLSRNRNCRDKQHGVFYGSTSPLIKPHVSMDQSPTPATQKDLLQCLVSFH